jgi:hypothetical protein
MGFGEVTCSTREGAKHYGGKILGATECESGIVEVLWDSVKECVLVTVSGLVVKWR